MALEDKIKKLLESKDEPKVEDNLSENQITEHIAALFEGEELSEEFKSKAETIFEAAVSQAAEKRISEMEEQFQGQLQEAVDSLTSDLVEQIDGYLNHVVEQWAEDNTIALENGLRSEMVTNFIDGLKNLFVEHYVEVPEEKADVLGEQAAEIDSLKGEVNKLIESNMQLQKTNKDFAREMVIEHACYDLTQVEKEKLKELAESVEFISEEEFVEKVKTLKESYITKQTKTVSEGATLDATPVAPTVTLNENMSQYVSAISRNAKF